MIKALTHIQAMQPYALAEMTAPAGKELISLAQNESLRPPSPAVVQAAADSLAKGSDYPDPDWTELRAALGSLHDIPEDMILCGTGSLDLIGCLARSFSGPDHRILAPAHAYPFFKTAAQMANARFDIAPEIDGTVSVETLLAAMRPDTAIVFVANPANPTGTHISKAELQRLRAGLRDDVILVIDEAYGEFADYLGERCWDMVQTSNCVVLRTFSKAYSMAGFRIGWGLFPDAILTQVRKVMNPNNVTLASQVAALAAVRDQNYMQGTCQITTALREKARLALTAAGFDVLPSVTNFLLIRFENGSQAEAADAALRTQGIFLRRQQGAGLPHALRMTIGPEPATLTAIAQIERWMKETRT
jgi:histidinol-phosphate aminotransferase